MSGSMALLALCLWGAVGSALVPSTEPDLRDPVAVFDLGDAEVRSRVEAALVADGFGVLDDGLVDAAGRGAGYAGSVNLTQAEANRLARTVGARALVLGTTSVVEREADNGERSWDAFVGLFFVDGRSGKLLRFRSFRTSGRDRSSALAGAVVAMAADVRGWGDVWRAASIAFDAAGPDSGLAPDVVDLVSRPDGGPDLIPPRFFNRPVPAFTDDADRAHAIATVDLVVQFNADGTYGPIEVVRWAGFGLDETAVDTVRACRFWPARRSGRPVTARALLRFNFRFHDR